MTVELKFVNSDATPKIVRLAVSRDSVAPIMEWYGSFYVGDRYAVYIDGVKVRKGLNGELVE